MYVTQFGTKKITKQPTKDAEVELTPSGIVAMNVYKHLVDDGFWSSVMKGPARAILESLECDKDMKINHIYSRRWTKKGKIVDKQEVPPSNYQLCQIMPELHTNHQDRLESVYKPNDLLQPGKNSKMIKPYHAKSQASTNI